MTNHEISKRIAVVGSGISGLSAAFLLSQKHQITVFEQDSRLGGHANTVFIDYPKENNQIEKIAVDTGFIVYNFRTYFHLKRLFEMLKVEIVESKMSFGIKDYSSGLEYLGSDLSALFAQRKNFFSPKFWGMIFDILKFNKKSIELIESSKIQDQNQTLEEFVKELKLGNFFQEKYLFPMASAIWSCPVELMKKYPAKTFLRFFYNHGLLTVTNQPQWYSVKGGSINYINKIKANFAQNIKTNCAIKSCYKSGNEIILENQFGEKFSFDEVIFACHADETAAIIKDKTTLEEEILSKFKFSRNEAILHRDENQMPKAKKAWGSWVYLSKAENHKTSLTYWMNNLQKIDEKYPLFVTLNPIEPIAEDKIFSRHVYHHPIFDFDAINGQERLDEIQGKRGIYFAGAWTRYGFHEDGILSSVNLAKKHFEINAPWNDQKL